MFSFYLKVNNFSQASFTLRFAAMDDAKAEATAHELVNRMKRFTSTVISPTASNRFFRFI
jgi:hypothetical protein